MPIYGLAVDIGTTSVAALIIDMTTSKVISKASTGNTQASYGADVINRIVYAEKPGGLIRLRKGNRRKHDLAADPHADPGNRDPA